MTRYTADAAAILKFQIAFQGALTRLYEDLLVKLDQGTLRDHLVAEIDRGKELEGEWKAAA